MYLATVKLGSEAHEHNAQGSCAHRRTCCDSLPRIFLTAPSTRPFLPSTMGKASSVTLRKTRNQLYVKCG